MRPGQIAILDRKKFPTGASPMPGERAERIAAGDLDYSLEIVRGISPCEPENLVANSSGSCLPSASRRSGGCAPPPALAQTSPCDTVGPMATMDQAQYERLLRFRTGLRRFLRWSAEQAAGAGL